MTGPGRARHPAAGRWLSPVGVLALVVLAAGLVLVGSRPAGGAGVASSSSFSLEQALAFDAFPLYFAGARVDGLPLTAVLRRDDTASFVSFVYGDCKAASDAGCAPPAEVQVWPACRRSPALYDGAAGSPAPEWVVTRGVRGAFFDRGTRLELQTGRSLVVVFARSRERALRIAAELRALDGSVDAGAPLPPPSPRAAGGRGGAMGC